MYVKLRRRNGTDGGSRTNNRERERDYFFFFLCSCFFASFFRTHTSLFYIFPSWLFFFMCFFGVACSFLSRFKNKTNDKLCTFLSLPPSLPFSELLLLTSYFEILPASFLAHSITDRLTQVAARGSNFLSPFSVLIFFSLSLSVSPSTVSIFFLPSLFLPLN